jgi:hypothetical protein
MLTARARRLVSLLAALTALVLAGCAGVTATPATHGVGAQDRVGALSVLAPTLVGSGALRSACSRPGSSVSGPEIVAGFCVATEEAPAAINGETSATAYGRAIHQATDYGPGFEKEFTLENGQRVDAVNFETREVIELKPNNPRAIARGLNQVQGYAQQLDQEFPGDPFTYSVQTYDRP